MSPQELLKDDTTKIDSTKFDWSTIASTSALKGTTWRLTPAGAQWWNGATESFVKKVK